ncbi:Uncharacterised protein [Mycobacteroides abscessus subsp. abscessus]|nr:Uncharacterised protein [Mycobacteroides abscessus subsp. abscessus]
MREGIVDRGVDVDPFGVAEAVAGRGLDSHLGVVAVGHGDRRDAESIEDGGGTQALGAGARPAVDEDRPGVRGLGVIGGQVPRGQNSGVGFEFDVLELHARCQRVGVDHAGPPTVAGPADVALGHGEDLPGHRLGPGVVFDDVADDGMTGALAEVETVRARDRRLLIGGQVDAHVR